VPSVPIFIPLARPRVGPRPGTPVELDELFDESIGAQRVSKLPLEAVRAVLDARVLLVEDGMRED
jgi:hypothetical protein